MSENSTSLLGWPLNTSVVVPIRIRSPGADRSLVDAAIVDEVPFSAGVEDEIPFRTAHDLGVQPRHVEVLENQVAGEERPSFTWPAASSNGSSPPPD